MSKFEQDLSYATHKKHTIKFKIVFVGDQAVGKSSIINRFIKHQFDSTHNPTVGIDFVSKNMAINQRNVRLQLWDTAGQQRFKSLIPGYLRDSHAIFLVYDITNRQSFENLSIWLDYVKEHRGDDVIVFVVGNKIDLEEERVVSQAQVKEKLNIDKGFIVEVSAKTGDNLENIFKEACDELLKSSQFEYTSNNINQNLQKDRKKHPTASFQGEKQKPIKKDKTVVVAPEARNEKPALQGSKLMKKDLNNRNGKVVREKNCC